MEKRATQQIENLGGYLYQSLKYQIIGHYRKQLLAERYSNATLNKSFQHNPSPENEVNFQEITAIFERVLRQLPEKTSQIFRLSRLEFKTTREISELLQMSERTVEYHITQSLKLLRQQLKDFLPTGILLFFSLILELYLFKKNAS